MMFPNQSSREPILVLGIGNWLMGDEGVGIHAIRKLEKERLPPHVALLDGGTGGFHLLSCFEDHGIIVMIDAALDGKPPGTVSLLEPRFASEFPRVLSAHDIGLRDLIESAALLGPLPKTFLITVSVTDLQDMTMTLSPEVEASIPRVVEMVKTIVGSPGSRLESSPDRPKQDATRHA
jgi:hydrogenase maturation protease